MFSISNESALILADALADGDRTRREEAKDYLLSKGAEAAPILHAILEDSRARVRWEAALVMKELTNPSCVDPLLEALKDENEDVRWVAAEGLGAIGMPSVRPFLLYLIQEADSFEVRDTAHVAISHLNDGEVRELLKPVYRVLVDHGPPETIIAEANRALDRLGPEDKEG